MVDQSDDKNFVKCKYNSGNCKEYKKEFAGTFDELMKQNGYIWKFNYDIRHSNSIVENKTFDCDKLNVHFVDNLLIIANSNSIICYNMKQHTLEIYYKQHVSNKDYIIDPQYDVIPRLKELGIELTKRYNK